MNIPVKLGIPEYEFRLVFGSTKIDYDISREMINRKKHGYSFESAVHLLQKVLLPINTTPFATIDGRGHYGSAYTMEESQFCDRCLILP